MKSTLAIFIILFVTSQGVLFAAGERIEFAVSPSTDNQENPNIYGNIVVWQQLISQYEDYDILAADINNPGEPPFFHWDATSDQTYPAIFEKQRT